MVFVWSKNIVRLMTCYHFHPVPVKTFGDFSRCERRQDIVNPWSFDAYSIAHILRRFPFVSVKIA